MASNSVKQTNMVQDTQFILTHLPAEKFNNTTDVVILICLDDFSKENGSTKILYLEVTCLVSEHKI